jgi:hypothetical protein
MGDTAAQEIAHERFDGIPFVEGGHLLITLERSLNERAREPLRTVEATNYVVKPNPDDAKLRDDTVLIAPGRQGNGKLKK